MGVTDIDDKIIKRSLENYQDYRTLSRHFEGEFFDDMDKLNVRRPYLCCRVTDYMPQIISFVEKLVTMGHGYVAKDGTRKKEKDSKVDIASVLMKMLLFHRIRLFRHKRIR